MGQVIQVSLYDPDLIQQLSTSFTQTSSANYNEKDHTPMHKEAIQLALTAWSGGSAILDSLKRDSRIDGRECIPPIAWKYGYRCIVTDSEGSYAVYALLFTEYREKKEQESEEL